MGTSIFVFIMALIAELMGFLGLIVLIYGFKNNSVGTIKKGTVICCIAILFFTIMAYKVTKKAVNHYKQKARTIEWLMTDYCCNDEHPTHPFCHGLNDKEKEILVIVNNDTVVNKTE